jgi:two-component sensor histidine kinase
MTTATGSGVLQRMTQRQQPDAPDVPLTASRAVRLALARGAQTSIGLPVTVGSVAEQALPLDELLAEFTDELLLISLTRDGAICGILACDAGLVAAAIEVMTTGKISAGAPDTRAITKTEGTLLQPLLRALLDEVLSENEDIHNFEVAQDFHLTGRRSMLLTACKLRQEGDLDDLILIAIEDVTERKRFDEHREVLVGELNHRIKNVMATVQAIASQTLKSATSMEEARATFGSRLIALGKSHDLLTRENWGGADLRNIVKDTVEPLSGGSNRFRIEGPHLWLAPSAALSIAMALHELATNAAKYGALATEDGQVDIRWQLVGDGKDRRLSLRWLESGGPPVVPPTRKGFGSVLVQKVLATELGGQVDVVYDTSGVVCTIDAPMPDGQEKGETS